MRFRTLRRIVAIAVATAPLGLVQAQQTDSKPAGTLQTDATKPEASSQSLPPRSGHLEVPRDPYVPVPRAGRATSPAVAWTRNGYVSIQVNVDAAGGNIIGDAANEPSIAVDGTNPTRMAIGWRQFDTILSDFRQAGWGYTTDAGQHWTFPGVIEPGVFRSDPVLDADAQGNFYYYSLTTDASHSNFWCHMFKSTDGGASWDSGTYAYGGDKEWMTIDRTNGIGRNNIYASWNLFYSSCSGDFTRSYDSGQTFLPCTYVPDSPYWGTLAVGPDGELYVSGIGFTVAKSTTMQNQSLPAQWDFSTSVNLGGSMVASAGPNPGGLLGQAWIAVDHSGGPTRGNVYLLCSADPTGLDPLDVMFARSTNGGLTWSAPVRVNDDPVDNGAWQWFATMSVAPNGRIDAVWNDTRNDPGGYDSELYYAFSTDAGQTWSVNEPLSPPFDPHVGWPMQNKIGDYYDMVSDDNGAHVAYSATFNGEQDVYYLRIGSPVCPDAGTVTLDRDRYACESTANIAVLDCGLNGDDNVAETVTVSIDSTSEPAGESALLTETGPATALFEGAISLSEINSSGVLLVAEGDTVTATYIDADDGQGGTNVTVTDTAVVDCTPPVLSNVQILDVQPHSATISFDGDEPILGSVFYGESCSSLPGEATSTGYDTTAVVQVSGLQDNTTYYFAVHGEDEAGNTATDDNGGTCYTFNTPDVPNYFTEQFTSNDLDNLSLIFEPDGSTDFYAACVEPITTLPTDPAGGTTLSLADDSYATVNLTGGATVSLYGTSYTTIYPGSNGYLTFTGGDSDYSETLTDHFDTPRVSALFDDLNPSTGGTVSYKQLADRIAVTWDGVYEHSTTNPNTFQIVMYFDGGIEINYLSIAAMDGIAGLSAGGGIPPNFYETDLSAMGACGPRPPTAQSASVSTAVDVPLTVTLLATDDGLPVVPGQLTYIVTALPGHGSL
ncbi:MAG: hypothetical protein JSV19_00085, partial [Phycisphaerales bacterium]